MKREWDRTLEFHDVDSGQVTGLLAALLCSGLPGTYLA
jgi:hypothetical protein